MWLVHLSLRRPVTILVGCLGVALLAYFAVRRMAVDIFPDLNLPVIIVAQPYGGMDPAQMEGFLVYYYEYHFLYITGIDHVESKSIQNVGLIKLFFHPGTDMSQALAQTVSYVDRSRAFMPPGTVPPFVVRFDAGTVPVGQLIFSSDTRSVGEIQDLALNRVRPTFATLPGVSAPPPFGAGARTVVIRVDPDRLRALHMSPDEVTRAIASGNAILPGGNVRTGDLNRMAAINSPVARIRELEDLPIRVGTGPTVYVHDVATVNDGSDILTGYALVNGRRTVFIPVTKRADASTVDVVQRVKSELPRMQALVPDDIKVEFQFDQSVYVTNALRGLAIEGALGALLTGLVVWLFLRAWRSAVIVVLTIPFALLGAVVGLWLTGQTLNIMTLGGLALAIGILVDEATVDIENIHTHLAAGDSVPRAVINAARETRVPRLLAVLSILAVFVPSFFMTGVAQSLFVPLSLAVAFAMLFSYALSNSMVPVLGVALLRKGQERNTHGVLDRVHRWHDGALARVFAWSWAVLALYVVMTAAGIWLVARSVGTDMFPAVDTGQFQLRLRAPIGTRVERTEEIALKALETIREEAGPQNVEISLMHVGTPAPNYPINSIYLWSSGPHEALLTVALRKGSGIELEALKERLRQRLPKKLPNTSVSFEAGDVVSQIMNFGAPTPIEVAVTGPNLAADRAHAEKLMAEMRKIESLRDLQFAQPLDYPTMDIRVDRERAGQLGVTMEQVGRSLAAATSSSRYVMPSYWRDPNSGIAYQVQVEIPQSRIASVEDIHNVPIMPGGASRPLVQDVAEVSFGTTPGEYDRYNQQRMITIIANTAGSSLGDAASDVDEAIRRTGEPPRGVTVNVRGQVAPMRDAMSGFRVGLIVAIVAIFLLMAANFQSLRLALVVLAAVPAVILGVGLALLVTRTTLNVQSFIGAIMAIGVSVANAILLVTFAEKDRRAGKSSNDAASLGAHHRLRPILMTSLTMIAGMVPMALGIGEGADQTAPLGRAVIGGLLASTFTVLIVLPAVFAIAQRRARGGSASWHPDDATAAAIVIALLGAGMAAPALRAQGQPGQTQAPATPTVAVAKVTAQQLDRPVSLPGELSAFQDVEVRAKVAGFVDSIAVDRGSQVRKGQVLVRLVAPELTAQRSEADAKVQTAQSQRVEAEAKLASDEATYERLKAASATPGVVAGNDLEVARRTVDADRARVQSARDNERAVRQAAASVRDIESYLRITAPFDGVVTERNVHVGSLVGPPSGPLLRVQQVATLRLTVAVPESAVAGAQPKQVAKFTVPAYPGETFVGTVTRIARALDPKTRTMAVELDVANPTGRLAPGMYATVAWSMRRLTPSLFVPASAIATTTERTFVVRIRNGVAEWVDVRRGVPMNQLVEVFGDLQEGDQVAVRGTDEIRSGTRVNPKPPSQGL